MASEQPPTDWSAASNQGTAPNDPPISPLNRFGYALALSPKAFQGALRPVDWAVALLIVMGVFFAVGLWTQDLVLESAAERIETQLESNPSMSPEEMEQARGMLESVAGVSALVIPVLWVPLSCLVITALLLLMVNFAFGGSARFAALWAVACLGWAPKAIEMVLVGILRRVQGTAMISFSPAALLPDDGSLLRSILNVFDIFDFWMLGIHIVGLGVVATLTSGKARSAVLVVWIIIWIIGIAAAVIGHLLGGAGGS